MNLLLPGVKDTEFEIYHCDILTNDRDVCASGPRNQTRVQRGRRLTMYLDKPLAGHNLMQAIAQVNRVYGEKPGGLIVDLIVLADPQTAGG